MQHAARRRLHRELRVDARAADTPRPMPFRDDQRHERGEHRRDRVPERARERVAGAVGAGLRDRAAAGGEDDVLGVHGVIQSRGDGEGSPAGQGILRFALDDTNAKSRPNLHPRLARRAQQRIDHVARAVADREQLPRLLALQRHAELFEERRRARHVERAQHLRDRVAIPVEVLRAHDVVRHVAAAAAGDQDLRADARRGVERDHAPSRAPRGDPRPQPRAARRAMSLAAPPDDENTALIAFLGNERLYRTTYLSMTRGDGGQNLIGDEKGELLGVIRTQELLAARRIDGGEQAFTRAIDFGYSKNPQETLAIWGHDTILADVVWNIRRFQPDVIITRFPTTGEGGHGHHTASAILAVEAFKLAGDPSAFPDQLKYVAPWQPRRLFWNRFSFQPIKADDPSVAKSLRLDVGTYNATLGRAYTEIAAESRSQHKSQGFGSAERRGSLLNYFDQLGGDPAKSDIFEGIDTTWSRLPGGEAVGKILHQASDEYDPKNPSKSLPLLIQAYAELDRLKANDPKSPWPAVKQRDVAEAIRAAAGMSFDVAASDSSITPGGEITVNVSVVNRSDYPFTLDTVGSRYGDPSKGVGAPLKNNEPVKTELKIKVPPSMEISQPYWLQQPPAKGTYTVTDPQMIGLPENPPAIPLVVTLSDNAMPTMFFNVPAVYRWTDAVRGEQVRNVDVVPEVTANLGAGVYVFPDAQPKPVTFGLRTCGGAGPVSVRLRVQTGWSVEPISVPVTFEAKGDEAHVTFRVPPPKTKMTGT